MLPCDCDSVNDGVIAAMSAVVVMLAEASLAAVIAVTEIGTFCRFSERRWAVTTISVRVDGAALGAVAPLCAGELVTGPAVSGVDVCVVAGWEATGPCEVCWAYASVVDPMHNDNARALGPIFSMVTSLVRGRRTCLSAA